MSEVKEVVYIRQVDDKWAGFTDAKQVTKPACKNCVLKLLQKMTRNSNRYDRIIIVNEDETRTIHLTGAANAGNTEES